MTYVLQTGIGAPVWQYTYGRAVLIGIRIGYLPPGYKSKSKPWYCLKKDKSVGIVVRITEFIDWLKQNVK